MAKSKPPRKKYTPPRANQCMYRESVFHYSKEDSDTMNVNAYMRLIMFAQGHGQSSDRTSFRIRLLAGKYLCGLFEDEGQEEVIDNALQAVKDSAQRIAGKTEYSATPEALQAISEGLQMVERLLENSSFAEEVIAYKHAEDQVVLHADGFEYIVLGAVEETIGA